MALTLSQLVEAIAKYEDRLTGSTHDKAAFARNIDLLRGRVGAVAAAAKALAPEAPEALSSDPSVAIHQILAAIGLPTVPGQPGATSGQVLAAATPEQARELALLGTFGQPGAVAAADYSLFEKYYQPVGQPDEENGMQSWDLKPEYQTVNVWADYLDNQD